MLVLATLVWSTVTWAGGAATVLEGGWEWPTSTWPTPLTTAPLDSGKSRFRRGPAEDLVMAVTPQLIPSMGYHNYTRVCGKIKAYQQYSTDAFQPYYLNRALTIDDLYVDGVSLTHGQNPRNHIWTFANAIDEVRSNECMGLSLYENRHSLHWGCTVFCWKRLLLCYWKPIRCCKPVLQRGPTMGWSWM